MRVVQFGGLSYESHIIHNHIWYIEDNMKLSQIIDKVEKFLRVNKEICYMSLIRLYNDIKEFETENVFGKVKKKSNIQYIGC